jgi:AcrR family transcriptional regulator
MARQRILDAAADLAEEDGAHSLSLERVADRAGVSKGGLLYHFHTKEELLTAMLQSVLDAHDADIERRVAEGASRVDAVLDHCLVGKNQRGNLMSAFIAAVAVDGHAQEMVRERKRHWHEELRKAGLTRSQVLVLSMALDGLFVGSSLGVTELSEADRLAFHEGLTDFLCPSEEARLADWFRQALERVDAC